MHYEVETFVGNGWENVWRQGAGINNPEGNPVTFATADKAEEEIKDHITDCINAVEGGEMEDSPDPSEFRIMAVTDSDRILASCEHNTKYHR